MNKSLLVASSAMTIAAMNGQIDNFEIHGNIYSSPIYTPKKTKFKGYMRDKTWIKRHKKK